MTDDLLSAALDDLRLASSLHCRFELQAPWAIAYPAGGEEAAFHVVTAGTCVLEVEGESPVTLSAGDFVVLPHGGAHRLRAEGERVAPLAIEAAVRSLESQGGAFGVLGIPVRRSGDGAETRYLCGAFQFASRSHPIIAALPRVLHVNGEEGGALPGMEQALAAVAWESTAARPGGTAVIARLAEVLFVQAIRAELAALPPDARGWLAALRDPSVSRALARMHAEPEREWAVDTLAREAAMSRSRFAARFTALVGEPPLTYLGRWRMHRAGAAMRDGGASVAEVAARFGYRSPSAFSVAFKRLVGEAPARWARGSGARPTR